MLAPEALEMSNALTPRCNPLTCTNAIAVSYPQTLDALVHKLIIKTIEEPKLRPTGLQELHISSWENDSLEGNKPSLILLTSLIKQLKDTFLAVWVVLQTKSDTTNLSIRLQKLKKGRLPDEMRCRTEGVGLDLKVRWVHVSCLETKSQVPEEVPQSPWPPVWGCGMQSRPWHPPCGSPEEFSNVTSLTHFSFLAHFRLSKEVHSADEISTFSGGSLPEDFDVGFVSWR